MKQTSASLTIQLVPSQSFNRDAGGQDREMVCCEGQQCVLSYLCANSCLCDFAAHNAPFRVACPSPGQLCAWERAN